jgi:uncharacterized protein
MKILITGILSFLLSVCLLQAQSVNPKDLPEKPLPNAPFKRIIDNASLLSYGDRVAIEDKLRRFEDSTSNQVLVVTVKQLFGYDAWEYATAIGEKFGVGKAKQDNGVVFLICDGSGAEGEKKKVFIAVGTGLQGIMPDAATAQIIREEVIPGLKQGNYYSAINNGVNAIHKAALKEYNIKGTNNYNVGSGIPIWVIVIGFIIIFVFISRLSRLQRKGGMASRRGYRDFNGPVFFPPFIGGGNSGGGFFDNDSGGGGGIDVGDFGGGSFDGGGAGGDW